MQHRVIVVDDSAMSRMVFEGIVEGSDDFVLVGSFSSTERAVAFCKSQRVDLAVLDVVMPSGMNGLEAAAIIKHDCPRTKVLVVTSMPEVSYLTRARMAGVDGFWYKEVQDEPLLSVMEKTMAGEKVWPESTPVVTLGNARSDEFTPKELQVLREMVGGATNQEIAESLGIGAQTVKTHITNMLQKTGFKNRLELAVKARVEGLVIQD